MAFNPDAYLKKTEDKAFDPDAYLTQAKTAADVPAEEPGRLEAFGTGLAQGSTFGLSDELAGALAGSPTGAAKTIANILGANFEDKDVEDYKARRDVSRASNKAAEEAHGGYALGGNVLGGAIPMALAAMATGGGAPAAMLAGEGAGALGASAIGKGIVQKGIQAGAIGGAGYGLGQSEADTTGGLLKDTAVGGAVGGVTGGIASQIGKFLGGNKADVLAGVASKEEPGVISDLTQSKLGQRFKGFFKAGQEGVDTSSEGAELARGLQNKEEAGKIIDVASKKATETGKAIGEKVKAAGSFKPESIEQTLTQLPQEVQEEVLSILPGRIKSVSDAPAVLQAELLTTEKNIQHIISENPDQTTKYLQKVSTDLIDPVILDGELQYSQVGQRVSENIKQSLQENPEQTLGDLYNTIVKGHPPSADLDDLFQQLKYKSVVAKLAKEAQVKTGSIPESLQSLQSLLDKKTALKKAVSQFGKSNVSEPDQMVKEIVKKIDTSHIVESDKIPAQKLKDIISKYIGPDGKVSPEKTTEFKNSLNHFRNSTDSYEIGNLAKQLETEVGNFRRQAAGDLSGQFHDLKSFADMLKVDTTGMTQNEIKNELAPRFAKYIAKSEGTATMDSGMAQDLVDKFVDSNGKDPQIAASLAKIAENAKYSELHKVKSGSTGSMFNDGVNRLLFAFPLETAGQISTNPIVKALGSTSSTASSKLINLPAAGWRMIGAKMSTVSPTMSKMANQMADASDDSKKRAILNVLNQMPLFRKSIEGMASGNEE